MLPQDNSLEIIYVRILLLLRSSTAAEHSSKFGRILIWNDSYLERPRSVAGQNVVILHLVEPEALDRARLETFARLLSDDERHRWRGFRSRQSAAQFLVGRGLLRTALSEMTQIAPAAWRFAADAYGKPHVVAPAIPRDLRFNLSHTRGLVALAVCEGFAVGVDVEEMRPVDVAELAPLALAPEERAALDGLAPQERIERFYRLWTLKEAYAKARGFGLSLSFPEIVFETDGRGWRLVRTPQDAASWGVVSLRPTLRHRLAVAAPVRGLSIVAGRNGTASGDPDGP